MLTIFETSLRSLEWSDIRSQSGSCQGVPDALMRIASSDDKEVRSRSYWDIENSVVVQGGIYDGAFFTIPFLLQICVMAGSSGKSEALELLYEIAAGATSFDSNVKFRIVDTPFRYYTPDPLSSEIPLGVASRFAIGNGVSDLLRLCCSSDSMIRKEAIDLVTLFPEFGFAGVHSHSVSA